MGVLFYLLKTRSFIAFHSDHNTEYTKARSSLHFLLLPSITFKSNTKEMKLKGTELNTLDHAQNHYQKK